MLLGIFTLRTYAIYRRSRIVLFFLSFPGLVTIASSVVRSVMWLAYGSTDIVEVGSCRSDSNCASNRTPNWSSHLCLWLFFLLMCRVCFSFGSHVNFADAFNSKKPFCTFLHRLISSQPRWSILFLEPFSTFSSLYSRYTVLVASRLRVGEAALKEV